MIRRAAAATVLGLAVAPAAAHACTTARSVVVRAPAGVRVATVYRDGVRVGRVRSRRRVALGDGGGVVTLRVAGRTASGRRVARVRHLEVCARSGHVGPDSPLLRYEGRWDVSGARALTVNSGGRVFLRFTGAAVDATFDTTGITRPARLRAFVDGRAGGELVVDRGRLRLTPDGLGGGTHTLELAVKDVDPTPQRWYEPLHSALRLTGFELGAGTVLEDPPSAPRLHFTFLGDSITEGLNIDCTSGGADCADATRDYAWLVARDFDAALEQVGFGGQGVTKGGGGGVPPAAQTLDRIDDGAPAPPWDADLVVINQTTNDVRDGATPEEIQAAYADYLRRVRARYPRALIIALEPFGVSGAPTPTADMAIRNAVDEVGDPHTRYVSTRGWLGPKDFTEGIHPNAQGHRAAAAHLSWTLLGFGSLAALAG